MQKRIERQLKNIQRAAEQKCDTVNDSFSIDAGRIQLRDIDIGRIQCNNYHPDETVFIDAAVIRRVKRKAIQMKSRICTHIAGTFYQQCMEELGIWDIGKEEQ